MNYKSPKSDKPFVIVAGLFILCAFLLTGTMDYREQAREACEKRGGQYDSTMDACVVVKKECGHE